MFLHLLFSNPSCTGAFHLSALVNSFLSPLYTEAEVYPSSRTLQGIIFNMSKNIYSSSSSMLLHLLITWNHFLILPVKVVNHSAVNSSFAWNPFSVSPVTVLRS